MDQITIQRYFQEVLGISAAIVQWRDKAMLPFYLLDLYDFAETQLFDRTLVLVMARGSLGSQGAVRLHLDKVRQIASDGALPILVAPGLASYERRRLIAQQIPFVVPGNQMFLPPLGLDLRQYFRNRPDVAEGDPLSPAAQALLLTALLRPWTPEVHPESLNERFGYTGMTVSRAVQELEAADLAMPFTIGRKKWLRFEQAPREVWLQAQPRLRSPVHKTYWTNEGNISVDSSPLAGMSALSAESELAAPRHLVRAISKDRCNQAGLEKARLLNAPEAGAIHWQIWRYDPLPLACNGQVDPLSLITTFRDDHDERVRYAIDQLNSILPW